MSALRDAFPRAHLDRPALAGAAVTTWRMLWAAVDARAARLTTAPHERVALEAHPTLDVIVELLALWERGAIPLLLSARFPPALTDVLVAQHGGRATSSARPIEGPGVVVFSSGSTGTPKAALLSLRALMASASAANTALAFTAESRWLLSLPLNHVGGLGIVVRAVLAGASLALPGASHAAEARNAATHVSFVATQLRRALRADAQAVLGRHIILGGGPTPPALVREAHALGLTLTTTYGLTELGSMVTATSTALDTSGSALAAREVRIVDGEICVRGPSLFDGYLEPAGLRLPVDDDGWFHTGDLGELRGAGLVVHGRRDSMLISGGENVHPEAIEAALATHPRVAEAVVVAIDDEDYGARPFAFVRLDDAMIGDDVKSAADEATLRAHVAALMPRFAVPDRIVPWPKDALVGMKPDRPMLRSLAQQLQLQRRPLNEKALEPSRR